MEQLISLLDMSRFGAGLLVIPEGLQGPDHPLEDDEKTIEQEIWEALSQPIIDRDPLGCLLPIILRGPDELVDKIRHIDFSADKEFRDMLCSRAYTLKQRLALFDDKSDSVVE